MKADLGDLMKRDLRDTPTFRDIEQRYRDWYRPGEAVVAEIEDAIAAPCGRRCVATGVVCDRLEGLPASRIVEIDLVTGALSILTEGPNSDRSPRWSPDGSKIAFLSDRKKPLVHDLLILDQASRQTKTVGGVDGLVEYHQWSADGRLLLFGVAGLGADLPGALGGVSIAAEPAGDPEWMPDVDSGSHDAAWRSLWIYDLESEQARRVSPTGVNVWEASWCGPDAYVAVCSSGPGEESWYQADLRWFPLDGQAGRQLYKPKNQLGWLSASPGGMAVAVVEAVCSDRLIVAGDLLVIDVAPGTISRAATGDADITAVCWRGEKQLLLAGLSGLDNLILLHDRADGATATLWRGREKTPAGDRFPKVFPLGDRPADCLFIREGWFDPPTLVALEDRVERDIVSFGNDAVAGHVASLGSATTVTWKAPDGLDIHGWLLQPPGAGPHPLVMNIHGGPIWAYRPHYLGRHFLPQSLLGAGYAVFEANPRGSSGRGQAFARGVVGDMGGADAQDLLSGIDHLVAVGIADPARLGLTGGSYGGFMTSWLITQDARFAAAVPLAPVTDWVSEHLTSHISRFCELFLDGTLEGASGQYRSRSPIHHAHKAATPALHICGARDKNTPPGQATEFHHALQRHGVISALVTYPLEGHGVRQMPASFDYLSRVVSWFTRFMPATRSPG